MPGCGLGSKALTLWWESFGGWSYPLIPTGSASPASTPSTDPLRLSHQRYTGKVQIPQEPARTVLPTLSLPGPRFTSGILEGKPKERLVECRHHHLVVTLIKGIT